jgi:hypothetical protein
MTKVRCGMALGAILALGAALRFWGLGRESFWHDEAWSWALIQGDTVRLLAEQDAHPPLYFLLLKGWAAIFGTGEAALRALSALFGIAALPLIFRLARRLGDDATALLATLLLALSPYHVLFSQEARSYTLLFALALGSLNLLFDARQAPCRGKWAAWAVLTAGVMYTHYMGGFFILAEVAVAAILRRDRPGYFKEFFWASVGAFALYVPWMPTFVRHTLLIGGGFWIPPLSARGLVNASHEIVTYAYLFRRGEAGWAIALTAPFYLMAFAVPFITRRREHAALTVLFAGPILGEILVSLARPLFYPRTFLYATIPLWILVALGVSWLKPGYRWWGRILFAGALLPGLLYARLVPQKENWRDASGILQASVSPDEPIYVDPGYAAVSLEYYLVRGDPKMQWLAGIVRIGSGTPMAPSSATRESYQSEGVENARALWLVTRYHQDLGWSSALAGKFRRRFSWHSRGIDVYQFVRD